VRGICHGHEHGKKKKGGENVLFSLDFHFVIMTLKEEFGRRNPDYTVG